MCNEPDAARAISVVAAATFLGPRYANIDSRKEREIIPLAKKLEDYIREGKNWWEEER